MARKPRLHLVGGLYHVMLRGNNGKNIFFDNVDREYLEKLIAEGVKRFDHQIFAYCWMNNHIHLAIEVNKIPFIKDNSKYFFSLYKIY